MGGEICLVTNILPNIFLCVQQNKEIHIGLEQLEGVLISDFLSYGECDCGCVPVFLLCRAAVAVWRSFLSPSARVLHARWGCPRPCVAADSSAALLRLCAPAQPDKSWSWTQLWRTDEERCWTHHTILHKINVIVTGSSMNSLSCQANGRIL